MNITILGAGAWGTALSVVLAKHHTVCLWGRQPQVMERMQASGQIQGALLPAALILTADFDQAMAHVGAQNSLLLIASSVAGLRPLCQALQQYAVPNLVWLCKGFEQHSLLLPHQVVEAVLGDTLPCGALSGPSFAQEVLVGKPCALTVATHFPLLSQLVIQAVHSQTIRVYTSEDVIGVEVGGAVKNILAIATGIADGLDLGLNARAALITRGLAEMTRLGQALGAKPDTFMGLTGMGDLILTCTGDLSRNRQVGLALAQGKQLTDITTSLGHVAEGVACVKAVQQLSQQYHIDMPITQAVMDVLFEGIAPLQRVKQLLSRQATVEK